MRPNQGPGAQDLQRSPECWPGVWGRVRKVPSSLTPRDPGGCGSIYSGLTRWSLMADEGCSEVVNGHVASHCRWRPTSQPRVAEALQSSLRIRTQRQPNSAQDPWSELGPGRRASHESIILRRLRRDIQVSTDSDATTYSAQDQAIEFLRTGRGLGPSRCRLLSK